MLWQWEETCGPAQQLHRQEVGDAPTFHVLWSTLCNFVQTMAWYMHQAAGVKQALSAVCSEGVIVCTCAWPSHRGCCGHRHTAAPSAPS